MVQVEDSTKKNSMKRMVTESTEMTLPCQFAIVDERTLDFHTVTVFSDIY